MLYKKIQITFILFALLSAQVWCQNIKEDLKAANLAIANSGEISMDIRYNFYCSCRQAQVSESKTSLMAKKGNVYYTLHGTSEIVTFGTLQLSIDNKEKKVVLIKNASVGISEISRSIEGLLNFVKNTDYKLTGSEKVYTLTINDYGIGKIEVRIDKSSSMLSRIVFYQTETLQAEVKGKKATCRQPKTEIVFGNLSRKVIQSAVKFNLNTYLEKRKDGSYVLVGSYKNYQLIDRSRN